jgi:hypothetical protein
VKKFAYYCLRRGGKKIPETLGGQFPPCATIDGVTALDTRPALLSDNRQNRHRSSALFSGSIILPQMRRFGFDVPRAAS